MRPLRVWLVGTLVIVVLMGTSMLRQTKAAVMQRGVTTVTLSQLEQDVGAETDYSDIASFDGSSTALTIDTSVTRTVHFSVTAPTGEAIVVNPPGPGTEIFVELATPDLFGPFIDPITVDNFVFDDLTGPAPTTGSIGGQSSNDGSPDWAIQVHLDFSGPIEFTGFSFDFTFPSSFNQNLTDSPVNYVAVEAIHTVDEQPPPAGEWSFLAAVPEPASAGLGV